MFFIFFLISFLASTIGPICGMGGGVIIKPVLDATGLLSISTVSFLSSCTVLSMSLISVFTASIDAKKHGKAVIELREGTPLAIGAVFGGIIGKELFQLSTTFFSQAQTVGAIQSGLLLLMTLGTLVYTLNTKKIKTHQIKNRIICGLIGLSLGLISAFLGIGGGPINVVVLGFFFSMPIKKAAANSLYIIMFSQLASVFSSIIKDTVPEFNIIILGLMILGAICGAFLGKKINKHISSSLVQKLFLGLMILIIGINLYNFYNFIN